MNKLLALMILLNVKKKKEIAHSKEEVENRFFFLLLWPRRKQILTARLGCISILIKSDPLFGLFMQGELGVNLNEEFKE